MKKYKHITNGELAELVFKDNNTVTLRMEDGNTKEVAQITFRRWWKPIEESAATEESTNEQDKVEIQNESDESKQNDESMKMSDVINKLEGLFDILNIAYFGGELPKPVITVQSTPKFYGHCTTKKIWKSEDKAMYEINIGAEFLNRPSANTAATMCHEMVHLYCLENEIKDTCQNGRYHNKTFKAEAEARDLKISYDRTVGYSHTAPTPKFEQTLKDNNFIFEVLFARVLPAPKAKREREKTHKYVCPICGQEVKSTADLNLICGECEVPMERLD